MPFPPITAVNICRRSQKFMKGLLMKCCSEMESVALMLDNCVDVYMKETFDEYLRSTDISNNIYSEKDKSKVT